MLREHRTASPITRWTMTLALALVVLGGFASVAQGEEGSLDQRRSPSLEIPSAPLGSVQAPAPSNRGGDVIPLPTLPKGPPGPRIPPTWSAGATDATNSTIGSAWFRLLALIRGRSV